MRNRVRHTGQREAVSSVTAGSHFLRPWCGVDPKWVQIGHPAGVAGPTGGVHMIILLVLLLALILAGAGFALHLLWILAVIVFVVWIVGWLISVAEGGSRRRWYRRY
jgi:hypothetical protein